MYNFKLLIEINIFTKYDMKICIEAPDDILTNV